MLKKLLNKLKRRKREAWLQDYFDNSHNWFAKREAL